MAETGASGKPPADEIGLYIHWPFCLAKCPYCDFNSHVAEGAVDQDRWRRAYTRQLAGFADEVRGRTITSVFFGGGTPSLMTPATVAAVLDEIARLWPIAGDVEITLEANPTSAEASRFAGYRVAGVNRLSLGVQALDDAALAFLGRHHSAREAEDAVALAARHAPRFSFDLIYARPGQTLAAWRQELARALAMAGDHLSVYQLTIERGTPFHRQRVRGADDETAAALYELTQEVLDEAGLPAYEISNHAASGGSCRHNLAIWQGGDYLGIGPGAHGRITRRAPKGSPASAPALRTDALAGVRTPSKWIEAIEAGGDGLASRTRLQPQERIEELFMLGLRLADGLDRVRFARLTGIELVHAIAPERFAHLKEAGLVALDDRGARTTPAGRLCLDAVLAWLLTGSGAGDRVAGRG